MTVDCKILRDIINVSIILIFTTRAITKEDRFSYRPSFLEDIFLALSPMQKSEFFLECNEACEPFLEYF